MDIVEQARNLIANEPVYDTLTVKGLVSEIERLREALQEIASRSKVIVTRGEDMVVALQILLSSNRNIAIAALKEGK